jgi:hypothetical protein
MGIITLKVNEYLKDHKPFRDKLKNQCVGMYDFSRLINISEDCLGDHWWRYDIYENFKQTLDTLKILIPQNNHIFSKCNSFEEFLDLLFQYRNHKDMQGKAFGPTLLYDLALVFGMSRSSLPEMVYLNNSKTQGTAKVILGADYNRRKQEHNFHVCFHKKDFPIEMHILEAHEIEDYMCIYHDYHVIQQR